MDEDRTDEGAGGAGRPRIVVGVDGSADGLHAVAWAARQARESGAVLRLLAAWFPPTPMVPMLVDLRGSYPERAAEHLRLAATTATRVAPGIELESESVEVPPAQALLAASRTADLLVVGRRGLGGLRGLLLGSVSQQCAEHAECPVVVVPRARD
jgi:nucleotide-binding universal stress UspA family protein